MPYFKDENTIKNTGYSLIGSDIKRLKKKVDNVENDLNNAFKLFRGIIAENGRTSHDFIGPFDDFSLFKMRHMAKGRDNKRGGYRIYYLTNSRCDFFLPVLIYLREEELTKKEAMRIIKSRLGT